MKNDSSASCNWTAFIHPLDVLLIASFIILLKYFFLHDMYFHSFLLNNFHCFPQDIEHSISLWKFRAHSSLCLYFSFPWFLPSCLFGEVMEETWLPIWPTSRTQAVGDASSPNLSLACMSSWHPLFPKAAPKTQLEVLMGWWANMGSTGDWTQWGLL